MYSNGIILSSGPPPDATDKPLPSAPPTILTGTTTSVTGAGDAASMLQGQGLEVMTPSPPMNAPTIAPVIVKPEDSEGK